MTITAKSCADFLRSYNDWRRGGEGPQLEPNEIGLNLDFAVEVLEFQHNFLAQITDAAAADDIATLEQESRQMRARMERLEKELETERALSFRNQVAELEKQRDELLKLILSFGHKSGCKMNAFGDRCTCGIDAAIANAKGGAA